MTAKSLFIVGLALMVGAGVSARTRKKVRGQSKPEVALIQPVPADSFSYAMGIAQSPSLKQYLVTREGIDTAYLNDVACGLIARFNEEAVKGKLAYAAGLKIGRMNTESVLPSINKMATGKSDSAYVDREQFEKGLSEGLLGQRTRMTDSEAKALIDRQLAYVRQRDSIDNADFLAANRSVPGVVSTPSGLQYHILKKGDGAIATDTSEVDVNYEGRLIDGTVFDSSYSRGKPATFRCNQVIKGWTEALTMMPEGSTWELYIPYDLAYGEQGNQAIPPFATLIFKVELLKVK